VRTKQPDAYWVPVNQEWGVRIFPRAGSTSFRDKYAGQNFKEFMIRDHKLCIVRHPWSRLMSVWYGMLRKTGAFDSYGFPENVDLTGFLEWIVNQDPFDIDPHITPMWAFMEGYWEPLDHQLITLRDFYTTKTKFTFPKPQHHLNMTEYPKEMDEASFAAFDSWMEWGGKRDLKLFNRAKKSPLVTGGNRDDRRRP